MTDTRNDPAPVDAQAAVSDLWALAGMPPEALARLRLTGREPVMPSSFAVSTAAQASIAACALAAAEIRHVRGHPRQNVAVDMRHAAQECTTYFTIDGVAPTLWDKISGIYPCGPGGDRGWVRIHANFAHHRDGALALLGCPTGPDTERATVERALQGWDALDFETAAAERGLVVAALRSFEQWDAHPQGQAVKREPLLRIERIGDAAPHVLPALAANEPPLTGVRVLDLTRILAGPVGTRALAAYGADVMLVNSPNLPNVALAETSRGKLSVHADLRTPVGCDTLRALAADSHVFVQGYRPGGLAQLGFGPQELARLAPGIVYGSLSAYGTQGPWAARRGFDSLVQTATGFNDAEGAAAGAGAPKALPMQILDHATGYLLALGLQAALMRQLREGGSWHVQVSLARTGEWLRSLGRVRAGLLAPKPRLDDLLEESDSGFGQLTIVRHSAVFEKTPAMLRRPAMPPGSHSARWP